MSTSNITPLRLLKTTEHELTIKVRILKLWRLRSFKNPNVTYAIEMILMDEEATKIEAIVESQYFIKFEKYLIEQECFCIKKFLINDNRSKYSLVEHAHKLQFNFQTEFKKCTDFTGPTHGFSFVSFDKLRSNDIPSESVVDIIGNVYSYYDMCDHKTPNGRVSKKMNLQLRDLQDQYMFVTLWESYAEEMSKIMLENTDGRPTVMILQFGRYKFEKGKAYVSTAFHGSSLYVSDEINDIPEYKHRLLEKEAHTGSSQQPFVPTHLPSTSPGDMWAQTTFNTMVEVNRASEAKSVVVMGIIKGVQTDDDWFYNACKRCNKKVQPARITSDMANGSTLVEGQQIIQCPNAACNNNVVSTVPRFRIMLIVEDPTDVVILTLWDYEASRLLKKTAKDLHDKALDGDNILALPKEIADLIGKKFAFKIDITFRNFTNSKSFTVNKWTDDMVIMSQLEKMNMRLEAENIEANTTICDEAATEEALRLKGGAKSNGKRKLTDLTADDECPAQTTPSSRPRLDEGEEENNQVPLA